MKATPKLVTWTAATLLIHAAIVAATSSPLFFRLSGRSAFKVFGGYVSREDVFDDVDHHYFPYAEKAVRDRAIPYRDFPVEYPILSLPAFVVPYLVTSDPGRYRIGFGVEMMLCDGGLASWRRRFPDARGPIGWPRAWRGRASACWGSAR